MDRRLLRLLLSSILIFGSCATGRLLAADDPPPPLRGSTPATQVIKVKGVSFTSFINASAKLCQIGSMFSPIPQRDDKQVFKKEIAALNEAANSKVPYEAEITVYPDPKAGDGPPLGIRTRMIFVQKTAPASKDDELDGFVPKDALPFVRAALSRTRASLARNQPTSGLANPVMKVGFFIARGRFASGSNEHLTIHVVFLFKHEDTKIDLPAYADLMDSSKGKYKKRLTSEVWVEQDGDKNGPFANVGEEHIKDGWNGVFGPVNESAGYEF